LLDPVSIQGYVTQGDIMSTSACTQAPLNACSAATNLSDQGSKTSQRWAPRASGPFIHACLFGIGAIFAASACLASDPEPGGGSATQATGSAAGEAASDANTQLETCRETLGTISIDEHTNAGWYSSYQSRYSMGSTIPALRLIVQQSNCFVIVDRGRGLAARTREAELIRGEEGRAGSNYGKGQIAAADYTMIPEVIVSDRGGTRAAGGIGGLLNSVGLGAIAGIAGSISTNEAGTVLTLVDNRSTVQLAAAEGYSKNMDIGGMGGFFGGGVAGGAGAYTSTPQGKVIFAAFMDSYNKMVRALRNYKAQTVKGGLGTGGRLGVQGGSTDASREVGSKAR
jgi:curli biogenesis system outer membrane secretion channel CsgG